MRNLIRRAVVAAGAVAVVLGTGAGMVAAAAAPAAAVTPGCVVVNTTSPVRTYTGSQALTNAVTAAAAGDTLFVKGTCPSNVEISKNLTITGHSNGGTKTATLTSGDGVSSVLVTDPGVTVTLNTLILTGTDCGLDCSNGGGIFNTGTLTLNGSSITGNTVAAGGGITNAFGGTVTLNGSSISGNTAGGAGGGIENEGTLILNGSSSISGNTTIDSGGGIASIGGTVTLNGSSRISGNSATSDGSNGITSVGGGIETVGGTVTLNGSATITGNTAKGGTGSGGGIYNSPFQPSTVTGATATNISGNHPDNCGGSPVSGCTG